MRKVLIISDYFRPGFKAGGPVKSVYNLARALNKEYDVHILTRNHDMNDDKPYKLPKDKWTIFDDIKVYYDSTNFSKLTYEKIGLQNFDHIYLNSLFSSTTINFLLKNSGQRNSTFLSPRGELGEGALKLKRLKKMAFLYLSKKIGLYKNVKFIGSAPEEIEDIKNQFPKNKIYEISNIANLSNYSFENQKKSGEIKLFFVSRISRKKNIDFVLKALHKIEGKVILKIIGPAEDENYYEECLKIIENLPENVDIDLVGSLEPDYIYQEITNYDFFILPTLNENYGHVISEALAYKKPVILSNNTPWTNYISQVGLGLALPLDEEIWIVALSKLINMSFDEYNQYENPLEQVNNEIDESNKKIIEKYKKIFK